MSDASFLARWSRRKAGVRAGDDVERERPDALNDGTAATVPAQAPTAPLAAASPVATPIAESAARAAPVAVGEPPLPTLDDVARLTRESDYAPFVKPGVDPGVKHAALKKLFSDPHFNVMDGLDTYIDDYGKPDPISPAFLRQMNQAASLGLFDTSPDDAARHRASPEPAPDAAAAAELPASAAAPVEAARAVDATCPVDATPSADATLAADAMPAVDATLAPNASPADPRPA